jgi:predicted transcriptional regulator
VIFLVPERRGRIEIVMAILDKASKGVNKTGIVYGANLNFNMAEKYLPLLMKRGLVLKLNGERGHVYEITEKGREVLKNYKEIKKSI